MGSSVVHEKKKQSTIYVRVTSPLNSGRQQKQYLMNTSPLSRIISPATFTCSNIPAGDIPCAFLFGSAKLRFWTTDLTTSAGILPAKAPVTPAAKPPPSFAKNGLTPWSFKLSRYELTVPKKTPVKILWRACIPAHPTYNPLKPFEAYCCFMNANMSFLKTFLVSVCKPSFATSKGEIAKISGNVANAPQIIFCGIVHSEGFLLYRRLHCVCCLLLFVVVCKWRKEKHKWKRLVTIYCAAACVCWTCCWKAVNCRERERQNIKKRRNETEEKKCTLLEQEITKRQLQKMTNNVP